MTTTELGRPVGLQPILRLRLDNNWTADEFHRLFRTLDRLYVFFGLITSPRPIASALTYPLRTRSLGTLVKRLLVAPEELSVAQLVDELSSVDSRAKLNNRLLMELVAANLVSVLLRLELLHPEPRPHPFTQELYERRRAQLRKQDVSFEDLPPVLSGSQETIDTILGATEVLGNHLIGSMRQLEVRRIKYSSPGFADLAGFGAVIGHIKDLVLELIRQKENRDRVLAEAEKIRAEGKKLEAEADRIRAEADQLRQFAILEARLAQIRLLKIDPVTLAKLELEAHQHQAVLKEFINRGQVVGARISDDSDG